ncbi:MAG: hypothetical protein AAF721_33250 [Myxococcota bacterium]
MSKPAPALLYVVAAVHAVAGAWLIHRAFVESFADVWAAVGLGGGALLANGVALVWRRERFDRTFSRATVGILRFGAAVGVVAALLGFGTDGDFAMPTLIVSVGVGLWSFAAGFVLEKSDAAFT